MRITSVESTELFVEAGQVVRVHLDGPPGEVEVRVTGPGVSGAGRTARRPVEVGVSADAAPGTRIPVEVTAGDAAATGELVVAEPGWTVWMVPHFHYDPVWWNTQAAYTTTWNEAGEVAQRFRNDRQNAGFALMREHLDTARRDPDYKFVLAEVDYLKPYWDAHPEDREHLRRLMAENRVELMGGTYNEPNTNLTSAESTIRNIVYGVGFQRDIVGGDPATAWQLDVFGHDPQFPGLIAEAGLTSSSWARGPYHQWGPMLTGRDLERDGWGDPTGMQFPAEFEWLAPSGNGVLTHYMPAHYSAGWWMDAAADLATAEEAVYELFVRLKKVAATRNLLLPVGTDYSPPNKWVTEIHRDWNARYVSPRFVCGLPREFFDAVRATLTAPSPQTRDMNPVYTGKDVSYIDTKQAQRSAESLVADAEKFATIAAVTTGARYPHAALDKAWRQLVYGAHHDAITGSESDQVYLDLLTGWREAHDLGEGVLRASLGELTARVDTRGDGLAVVVWNPSSWERTDLVRVRLALPGRGAYGVRVSDPDAGELPVLLENAEYDEDGGLAAVDVVVPAGPVPPLGRRTLRAEPLTEAAPDAAPVGWTTRDGLSLTNGTHLIEVDPARGGCVSRFYDVAADRELLQPGRVGNELLVYDEYPAHPEFHEGPWHLVPKGTVTGSAGAPAASVAVETCALGERVTVTGRVGEVGYTQRITLWHGVERVDCDTRLDFRGADQLVRLRWPARVPGALPVSEVGDAVVGRGFGLIDVDSGLHPWTLDNPAGNWFALSSTARVALRDEDGTPIGARAIGIAEIIGGEPRDLAVALVRKGVTATCSTAPGPRYGDLSVDSNLPDVRIALGTPEQNPFVARVLEESDPGYGELLRRRLAADGRARVWVPASEPLEKVWVPSADLTGPRALPVLIVAGEGAAEELVADLDDAVIDVAQPSELATLTEPALDDYTVGVINRGVPGFAVDSGGALHLSLLRSCTGWPSGVWIDPPRRTTPDGANFQLQHWTHSFEYSLVTGAGDWRQAGLVPHGHDVNHPLAAVSAPAHEGPLAPSGSFLSVEPAGQVVLAALKPAGNPLASGREPGDVDGVTLRLYEATGHEVDARVETTLPLGEAHRADLLERPLSSVDAAALKLTGMQVATVTAALAPSAAPEPSGTALGPEGEPYQPVYTRYWLNDTGPAPAGNMPVAVHLSETDLPVAGPAELSLSVASGLTEGEAAGVVTLLAPEGWACEPAERPYALAPGGHASVPVRLVPPQDAEPGVYWLRARTSHGGQVYEDVTRLHVGGRHEVGLEVEVATPRVSLTPGGVETASGAVEVVLRSPARTEVSVQAQLISPWHTFELIPEWNTGVAVPAGGEARLRFDVQAPAGARPGRWWAVVKLASAGWLHYTEAVEIEVLP
ncbi:glycoside hydrolase family 38 C-terminal domain-containing protein [Sphaerisporangium sp. TRM90804]|uniref:glycoside hydrolase family 38 N-terminal domain-containing protein n=1 Tax=Sphaerisporangium sp. TRM90804 TaxID=3031113 RepID=UPI002447A0D5|nr:glycoside hydrolase family 38 C-terminal domain-containing protein [Sphaerisporangium sp. TRM90804]MDH2424432.1 glycoside hydrolase family 38 C-terminal domain-containing protein [Sphaerisporangium sp. TRM90804]